jgi:hypothetical protein
VPAPDAEPPAPSQRSPRRLGGGLAWALAGVLCLLHGWAVWIGLGGRAGLVNGWPLARHDHPLYFHSALVTRHFLHQSGTTAGYDPSFMAGYAKSVIFPASSTLPELALCLFGGSDPVLAYKLYVLLSVAAVPWLVLLAARLGRCAAAAALGAVLLFLVYIWTDFPIQYATYGMVPYLLAVPLGLVAAGLVAGYLARPGLGWWVGAAAGSTLVVLVHFTSAMVVVPAAIAAIGARLVRGPRLTRREWAGLGAIPVLVLVLNAFWWWPGIWLAATKGESGFAFAHPEGVARRLWQIVGTEPVIQRVLWVLGVVGLIRLVRREPIAGAGLAGFAAAGFFWGYAAGASRSLDFLQPGRHTYALYTALAIGAGEAIQALPGALGRRSAPASGRGLNPPPFAGMGPEAPPAPGGRGPRPGPVRRRLSRFLSGAALASLLALGVYLFGGPLAVSIALRLGDPLPALTRRVAPEVARALLFRPVEPFLSSRPSWSLRWVVDRVRRHVRPGERLLYEEGGFAVDGLAEPFGEGRYSGLIPFFVPGVELLGGPYLHAALTTNFTQFGEGRLFGRKDWDRGHFDRYARLYRPAAILCWSPHARAFCRSHPDRIEVIEEQGGLLLGRVRGFEGAAIEGRAEVEARPGVLRVRPPRGGELDGRVVLRYHFVPHLACDPPCRLVPVPLEDDPVPFIGLTPPPPGTAITLRVPPSGRPADRP